VSRNLDLRWKKEVGLAVAALLGRRLRGPETEVSGLSGQGPESPAGEELQSKIPGRVSAPISGKSDTPRKTALETWPRVSGP
jgi:hypothetical protein